MGIESPKFEQPPMSSPEKPEEEKEPETTEEKIETEIQPDLRQQNKIIKILETGNLDLISEKEVKITQEEREDFLKKAAEGKIEDRQFEELLENIKAPFHEKDGISQIYQEIEKDKTKEVGAIQLVESFILSSREKRIKGDPRSMYSIETLTEFIEKFPTPSSLEKTLEETKSKIMKNYHESQLYKDTFETLEKDIRNLGDIIYGKRQEYWNQMKLLKKEVKELERKQDIEQKIKEGLEEFDKVLPIEQFNKEDIPLILGILQEEKGRVGKEKWQKIEEINQKEIEELKEKGFIDTFRSKSGRKHWELLFKRRIEKIEYNMENIPLKIETDFNIEDIVNVPEELKTDTEEGEWEIIGYDWERKIIKVKRPEIPSLDPEMPPLSPKYGEINLEEFKKLNSREK